MTENSENTSKVSEQDVQNLEKFAGKNLQAAKLSEVMDKVPSMVQRGTVYLITGALLIAGALLYFAKVPVTIVAKGKIVPLGKPFSVQAHESGVVTEVLVRVGDRLQAGDPLLTLDRSGASSGLKMSSLKRDQELKKTRLRDLRAEVKVIQNILSAPVKFLSQDKEVIVSVNTMQKINTLKKAWMDRNNSMLLDKQGFQDKKKTLLKEAELTQQKIELLKKDKTIVARDLKRMEKNLGKKKKDLDEFQKMVKKGIFSEQDLHKEEEGYGAALTTIDQTRKKLDEIDLNVSNERLRHVDMKLKVETEEADSNKKFKSTVINYKQSLSGLRLGLLELTSEIKKIETEMQNSVEELQGMEKNMVLVDIPSPIAGTVVQFEVKNPGEMISAGKVVASLVPADAALVVSADVPNKDIGFVSEGLLVRIKVDAYPFQQFGTIPGRVQQIFPNTGNSENFAITVELLQNNINAGDHQFPLFSGLTVKAELLTRKQRLIQLILAQDKKGKKGKGGKGN